MQKKKIKEYILCGIVAVIAIFTLVGMAFHICHIEAAGSFGYEYEGYKYYDTGFSLISFSSNLIPYIAQYSDYIIALCVVNVLHLVAGIVAIGLAIASFFVKKKKALNISVIVIGITFSLLYMVEGIVYVSVFNDEVGMRYMGTVSYVPFIVVAFAAFAYILVAGLFVVNNTERLKVVGTDAPTATVEPVAKKVDVEQIKQLKELLDMGAITQEEYDEKKKEILKG